MARLWVALAPAYRVLRFETATGGDEVLRAPVLARIMEPTSKLGSAWLTIQRALPERPSTMYR
jgi:hypothetical protein